MYINDSSVSCSLAILSFMGPFHSTTFTCTTQISQCSPILCHAIFSCFFFYSHGYCWPCSCNILDMIDFSINCKCHWFVQSTQPMVPELVTFFLYLTNYSNQWIVMDWELLCLLLFWWLLCNRFYGPPFNIKPRLAVTGDITLIY